MALVLNDLPRWISVVGLFIADVFFFLLLHSENIHCNIKLTNVPNYKKIHRPSLS